MIAATLKKDGRYATSPGEKSSPRRTANTRISFAIKIRETAGELKTKKGTAVRKP